MTWIKSNWRWAALNLFAGFVLIYMLSQGRTEWSNMDTLDSGLESGKWAIRFLLACLTMTPLNTYFGWKNALKLRKPAGLWAFGFASAHILLYIRERNLEWLTISMPPYLIFGLVGMGILAVLASTSNRWAMQRLGKNWKRLHRLVYLASIVVMTHSMLATTMSKKILGRDPEAPNELKVYVAILSVLLVVRIPLIRNLLKQIPVLLEYHRKPILQVDMPDGGTELWPKVHGRESSVSLKPTFIIPNEIPHPSEQNSLAEPFTRLDGLSDSEVNSLAAKTLPEKEAEVQ